MATAAWLLIVFVAWLPSVGAFNWTIADEIPYLSEVTLFVIREHISKFTTTVLIRERSLEPNTGNINVLLLDHILRHLEGELAVQLHIPNYKKSQWEYFVLIVDSAATFRMMILEFPINFYERKFYFFIILTKYTVYFASTIQMIFKLCYDFEVINANLLVDHPSLGVSMFTYRLFSEKLCRIVQPQLYFRFSRSLENLKVLFPEKLFNLHGCPLKISSRILAPMIIFTGNASNPKPEGQWDNLSGFEGMLLKVMAASLNFKIEFLPFSERETDMIQLVSGASDIAIGGFSGSDPDRQFLSQSKVYHHSPYMFVVRGGCLQGSLSRLRTPFKNHVWILIAVLVISGMVTILIVRCMNSSIQRFVFGDRNDGPMLSFVGIFLGYAISRIPRRNFARYIFILWVLVTLIIRNAYQGSLYDAIRMNRFARTPSGLNDLVRWNYKMIISPELDLLPIFSQIINTTVVEGTYVQRFSELEKKRDNYATLTLRDNYMHYIGTVYKNGSDLIIIKEVVYVYQVVMFFHKNSIFLSTINKKLQALIDSGITRCISTYSIIEPDMLLKYKEKPPTKSLTNERLLGVYKMFVCMMIMAFVVFCLELVSGYTIRIRRVIGRYF